MSEGVWLVWLGAALWYGASGLRMVVAEPEDVRLNRMGMIRAFHQAITTMRGSLRLLGWTGAGTVVIGILLDIISSDITSLSQAIMSVLAGLAFIGLTFHVEPLITPAKSRGGIGGRWEWLTAFYIFLSLAVLALASRELAQTLAPARWGSIWMLSAVGGALVGTALTSLALFRPVLSQDSPAMEVILAVVGSRWSIYIGTLIGMALVACVSWIHWSGLAWHGLLLGLPIALGLILIGIFLLRYSALRGLWQSILELPIAGMPERSLRSRVARSRRWTLTVVNMAFWSLLLTMASAIPLVILATVPPSSPISSALHILEIPTTTPTPRPTATLNVPSNQSASSDGVQVAIVNAQLAPGMQTLHLKVTNTQGQPIPNAHVTLAVSPGEANKVGTLVDATADADGNPADFVATVDFTQADIWDVVVVVATADQSILSSVSFTLHIN